MTVMGHTFDVLASAREDLAAFKIGDRITLLLTVDNQVAGAVSASTVSGNAVGMATVDGTTATVKLLQGGLTVSGDVSSAAQRLNDQLVTVTSSSAGRLSLTAVSGSTVRGSLDVAGRTLGDREVAENVTVYDQVSGGAMVAVLGLDTAVIEKICEETEGCVSIANYNCPGQIVITGEEAAAQAAIEKLTAAGAKRCVPLKVSGPFHSPMLAGAGEKLAKELEHVTIEEIKTPYIANVTADYVTDRSEVKALLEKQVSSSVKWQQTIERMIADGVDTFVEIGPGKTLSGFMRKISRDVKVINVEKVEDLEKLNDLMA